MLYAKLWIDNTPDCFSGYLSRSIIAAARFERERKCIKQILLSDNICSRRPIKTRATPTMSPCTGAETTRENKIIRIWGNGNN